VEPTRALRVTAIAVCAIWVPVLVLWGPAPFTLTFDDAFYYFQIGRELALGHGSTFNGLDHTNGYHPLWQGICALAFVVGLSGMAAVRALLVVQLVLYGATLWLVAGLVGRRISSRAAATVAVLLAVIAGSPAVLKVFVNGLESGAVSVAYAALLVAVVDRRDRWVAPLLVVAFLSRTDAVFVIGCYVIWSRAWRRAVPVAVVAAAYLAANWAVFGEPLQVSGVVKRQPLTVGRAAAMAVVALVALAVGFGARRLRSRRFAGTAAFVASTGWFAVACVLLAGYYRVLSAEVYLWYYAPVALYLVVVVLQLAGDFVDAVIAEGQSLRAVQAILALPFVLAVVLGLRQLLDPHLRSLQQGDRTAATWVRDNTEPGTVVASWDAGIVGYFSHRPVVNLDGVVNSFEWKDALDRAPGATRAFLDARNVELIVNHGELEAGEDPDIGRSVEALWGPGVPLHQVHRVEYVYAGTAGGRSGARRMATFVYSVGE